MGETKGKRPGEIWISDKISKSPAVAIASIFPIEFKMSCRVHPPEKTGTQLIPFFYRRINDGPAPLAPVENRKIICKGLHIVMVHLGYTAVTYGKSWNPYWLITDHQTRQISPVPVSFWYI